jgi:dihydrofolate reductase
VTLTIIAAISENRVIGRDGGLPWHLPADLKRFKRLTTGRTVIMGRRTLDSIGGRPLPERRAIIVTRNRDLTVPGATVVHTIEDAIAAAPDDQEVFVLGGGEIYRVALPHTDRMELTIVHAEFEGDTFFPEFDERDWQVVEDERHEPDNRHAYAFSFRTYERVRA